MAPRFRVRRLQGTVTSGRSPVPRIMATSLLFASLGSVGGWLYAKATLPPKILALGHANLYAILGAVCGLLILRLAPVVRSFFEDVSRRTPPDSKD